MELVTSVSAISRADEGARDERHERLKRVFRTCGDGLYRFIVVRVDGDRHAADDLLQQTCAVAAGHRRLPDDDEACEAWLRGVAQKLIRKHWRTARRRRSEVPLDDPEARRSLLERLEVKPRGGAMSMSGSGAPLDPRLGRALLHAVTALPAAEQQLIFSFYFDGRSREEIASEDGATVKSVEGRLYRARQRLRTILRDGERNGV